MGELPAHEKHEIAMNNHIMVLSMKYNVNFLSDHVAIAPIPNVVCMRAGVG